jgi:methionine sulfoxide reductase heme-binding subunit
MGGLLVRLRWPVWLGSALPALWLWWAALTDRLGAHPAEALMRGLGEWSLILLCATLAVTPAQRWSGRPEWGTWRRGLGLASAGYALQHFVTYWWLDMDWSLSQVWSDVWQRPFIAVGALALLLMLPLALTSFNGAIRRLGVGRWKRLHGLVHAIAALSLLHFYWMRSGKNDYTDVWAFAAVVALLWVLRAGRPRPRR